MRAYGLPRVNDVEEPDVNAIKKFARASHIGKFPKKNGKYGSGYNDDSEEKRATRRIYKKRERLNVKQALRNPELLDEDWMDE